MATQEPTPTGISPEDYCFFMSVDSECSKLTVTDTPDIKKSQTFMFLESDFISSIIIPSQAPSVSSAPS